MLNGAKRTVPRAAIAQNQKGCGPFIEAFAPDWGNGLHDKPSSNPLAYEWAPIRARSRALGSLDFIQ